MYFVCTLTGIAKSVKNIVKITFYLSVQYYVNNYELHVYVRL